MTNDDKKRFAEIMYGLAENFSVQMNGPGLKMRFEALKKFTIEQVEHAALQIVKRRKYTTMPTIADFIERMEVTGADKAEEQANLIPKAIRFVGRYNTPKFDDPITEFLVFKCFGWSRICEKSERDLPFFLREFKQAYIDQARIMSVKQLQRPTDKHNQGQGDNNAAVTSKMPTMPI